LRYSPFRLLGGGIALRHRPLIEVADTLAVDEQAFHAAGAGGASDPALAGLRTVNEVKLDLQGSASDWTYAYAEGRQLFVDDGNRASTLSAGAGVNLVRALLGPKPVELTARWDTYLASFTERRPEYYSPAFVTSQSPSAELRLRPLRGVELAGELGWTFAPGLDGAWFGGASGKVRVGHWSAALRAQSKTEPWYHSRRMWLAIETEM
jgi:hypothetical protein